MKFDPSHPGGERSRTRVLVVEDSITVRRRIVEVLSADADLEVVGEAADGREAIALCERLRPDVITLDMVLPWMSGLDVTEYVMAHCPTPILVVSSSTNRNELFSTYDALAAGAVDAMDKHGGQGDASWERELVRAVKLVARIQVVTRPRGRVRAERRLVSLGAPRRTSLVALGASTGGPGALLDVLRGLPPGFDVPILIVLHISPAFASSVTEWLSGQTGWQVEFARDGERWPPAGSHQVRMAPPERHLELASRRLRLTTAPERWSCRPSVDVLFESIAREVGPDCTACLLTGMGKDGAEGLRQLRIAGAFTLAQDESTSMIFGMPKAAIALGAAELVLPLDEIAAAIAASGEVGARGGQP